jgi:hypothetical protein
VQERVCAGEGMPRSRAKDLPLTWRHAMNGTRDIVFKRCGCTDEATGRQLAGRCPHLAEPGHGSWYCAVQVTKVGGRKPATGAAGSRPGKLRPPLGRLSSTAPPIRPPQERGRWRGGYGTGSRWAGAPAPCPRGALDARRGAVRRRRGRARTTVSRAWGPGSRGPAAPDSGVEADLDMPGVRPSSGPALPLIRIE